MPKHKKNPEVGTKKVIQLNKVRHAVGLPTGVAGHHEVHMQHHCFCLLGNKYKLIAFVTQQPDLLVTCATDMVLETGDAVLSHPVLQVWLDQADGQVLSEGEEVTLMDWGNAFIRVSSALQYLGTSGVTRHRNRLSIACVVFCFHQEWTTAEGGVESGAASARSTPHPISSTSHTSNEHAVLNVCVLPPDDTIALRSDAASLVLADVILDEKRY